MANLLGQNPVETLAQVFSALATAAAAGFAAASARSASQAAKEMHSARELSSAPLLTVTPTEKSVSYRMDLFNRYGSTAPGNELNFENHGNGPATNVAIYFQMELTEGVPNEDILVAVGLETVIRDNQIVVGKRERHSACFVSRGGIRWEPEQSVREGTATKTGDGFLVSLAKSEGEMVSIPSSLVRYWFIHAVEHHSRWGKAKPFVAHLNIAVTFDTMLRKAQRQDFRLQLNANAFPDLGLEKEALGSGDVRYEFKLKPVSSAPNAHFVM